MPDIAPEYLVQKSNGQSVDKALAGLIPSATAPYIQAVTTGTGAHCQTTLTITSLPVSVTAVSTAQGLGNANIFQFPLGRILKFGAAGALTLSVATADQADFTDATPEGQFSIGTAADANGTLENTEADLTAATDFTMASYATASTPFAAVVDATPETGVSTATKVYLNVTVDAADIDNDVTSTVYVSGTVTITWMNLGGA